MINTLQNLPEKVPSKGGNKFKKAIALAIALTLSGEPAEAKTYEKQEFPTEMVANIPGRYAPMTENVEQATVPNYISQAENGVKKYYPQYEEYFKPIFSAINGVSNKTKQIINMKIQENFEIFDEEIGGDKNKCEIILMVLEQLIGYNRFEKSNNIKTDSKEISMEIIGDINYQIKNEIKKNNEKIEKLEQRNHILKEILEYINNGQIDKNNAEKIIIKIEEFFSLFNINEVNNNTGLQKIINKYIMLNKQLNRTPSSLGNRFIEEYRKIK